ncbi:hypothetical protein BGZ76_000707 [Entomortierella beljakovae]|nr:hypothetical protein BGZ76_000707 [Entomortierella beljakovae]
MRGTGKTSTKHPEELEDQVLHRTMGASRIRSHTAKFGSHKIYRNHFSSSTSSPALPSTNSTTPGASGTTASSVSSYLENLPSINLSSTPAPPPRPPRPPGGMLGISNGRGMGYSRSLGSSYDSPLSNHDSFNGHVRSGANLYGGKSHTSGLSPAKPSTGHGRPGLSVFPIQKALEIAMKESRLLAASSKGSSSGSTGTGTGMINNIKSFMRHSGFLAVQSATITEYSSSSPGISIDEEKSKDDEHTMGMDTSTDAEGADDKVHCGLNLDQQKTGIVKAWPSGSISEHPQSALLYNSSKRGNNDIRILQSKYLSPDSKVGYPGIAHVQYGAATQRKIFSSSSMSETPDILSKGAWDSLLEASSSSPSLLSSAFTSTSVPSASKSTPIPSSASSSSCSSTLFFPGGEHSTFTASFSSTNPSHQSHNSSFFSSSSSSTSISPESHPYSVKHVPSRSAVHAVRELLDSYPAPSPYCVDDKKRSPLHFAAASGDLELVEFLLERGVRPDCGRDIAGNMPLHLGADMTLASPMTHKTPLDLAESRLTYLLSRAQESVKQSQQQPRSIDFYNSQVATRSTFLPPTLQSPALLYQIRGIVNLLRPYVARQQKIQFGEHHKAQQKERSWERANKYVRQQGHFIGTGNDSTEGRWRIDSHSDDNFGDMEDEDEDDDDDDMDTEDNRQRRIGLRNRISNIDLDGDMEIGHDDEENSTSYHGSKARRVARRANKRMNANETELVLENLMNGLSLLEANRKQQLEQQKHEVSQSSISDIGDGNLADNELDPKGEHDVEDALPDLLEQVQQVLQAIKLNEQPSS